MCVRDVVRLQIVACIQASPYHPRLPFTGRIDADLFSDLVDKTRMRIKCYALLDWMKSDAGLIERMLLSCSKLNVVQGWTLD